MDHQEIFPVARTPLAFTPQASALVHETLGGYKQIMSLAEAGRFVAEYTGLIWTIVQARVLGQDLHHAATRHPFWQLALSERPYTSLDGPGRFVAQGVARAAASDNAARDFLLAKFALSSESRRREIPVRVTFKPLAKLF